MAPGNVTLFPSGGPTFSADQYGGSTGSALFDGTNDLLGVGALPPYAMVPSNTLSVLLWCKLTDKAADRGLLWYGTEAGTSYFQVLYRLSDDRFVVICRSADGSLYEQAAETLGSPSAGQWYGIYASISAGYLRIRVITGRGLVPTYIELRASGYFITWPQGTQAEALPGEDARAMPPDGILRSGTAKRVHLGSGYGTQFHKGHIGDVCVYNRALSRLEQSHLFHIDPYAALFWPGGYGGPENEFTTALSAPTGLALSGSGPIPVTFTDNTSGIFEHELWRDDGTGYNFTLLTTLGAGVSSYEDADGTPLHSYKVRAVRNRGNPSTFASATGAQSAIVTEDGSLLTSEGGSTLIQE